MKRLFWKLAAAVAAFFIGTSFAIMWFVVEPKIFEIPVILPISESQNVAIDTEANFLETPDAAPKTMTFTESSSLEGKRDAIRDVKKGRLIILVRGNRLFQKFLEDDLRKYKIKLESIGCFFDKEDEIYLGGYNKVSKEAINKRFGKGFIEEAINKAAQSEKEIFLKSDK